MRRDDETCKMMAKPPCGQLMWVTMIMFILLCAGCVQTRYVPIESVRTDSVYLTAMVRDSICVRDSVIIYQAGDTIYVDKVRYRYRDKLVRDTVYQYRDREVQVPVPVERQLSWWDKLVMGVGEKLIPVVLILIIIIAIRAWRKLKGGKDDYLKRGKPDAE